jgi:arginyl-tRNA synthetase
VISCLEKIRPDLKGRYKHVPFGWLLRNNKKTSSRMGDSIKGMDILQEAIDLAATKIQSGKDYSEDIKQSIAAKVGIAGLRFLILSHEFHKDINYDPDQFISLEGFSGPYIMYAYSRARSILRQAELASEFNNKLDSRVEQELLRLLARYPEVAMQAAEQTAPHLVCVYLYDLAQKFNQFYKESPVLNATDENLKQSRLRLTSAAAQVLAAGLALLGIEVVENM